MDGSFLLYLFHFSQFSRNHEVKNGLQATQKMDKKFVPFKIGFDGSTTTVASMRARDGLMPEVKFYLYICRRTAEGRYKNFIDMSQNGDFILFKNKNASRLMENPDFIRLHVLSFEGGLYREKNVTIVILTLDEYLFC